MTDEQRLALKPGDRVMVADDISIEFAHVVRTAPWQLQSGSWVLQLEGISGCYLLSRMRRLIEVAPVPAEVQQLDLWRSEVRSAITQIRGGAVQFGLDRLERLLAQQAKE